MTVYAIRSLQTMQFYGLNTLENHEGRKLTKVVYFKKHIDAVKFASFLAEREFKEAPKIYEYEEPVTYDKYDDKYMIYGVTRHLFCMALGISGLGYHECEINNENVYCINSGIVDTDIDTRMKLCEISLRKV